MRVSFYASIRHKRLKISHTIVVKLKTYTNGFGGNYHRKKHRVIDLWLHSSKPKPDTFLANKL